MITLEFLVQQVFGFVGLPQALIHQKDFKKSSFQSKLRSIFQMGLFNKCQDCIVDGDFCLPNEVDSWKISSNFERLHKSYAENFSCLSLWEGRNPYPLYNLGTCWKGPFDDYPDFQQKARGCNNIRHNVFNFKLILQYFIFILSFNSIQFSSE